MNYQLGILSPLHNGWLGDTTLPTKICKLYGATNIYVNGNVGVAHHANLPDTPDNIEARHIFSSKELIDENMIGEDTGIAGINTIAFCIGIKSSSWSIPFTWDFD